MSGSMSRRGVVTGAAAIAVVATVPHFLSARPAGRRAVGHVVVDERLIQSAAFARGVRGSRIHVVSALDDLCNRWYTQLRRQVLADAAAIAGLTSWMDYVVMRSCAAEIGYLRSFHAEHLTDVPGLDYVSWPRALGEALASGGQLPSRGVPGPLFSAMSWPGAAPGRLVTWVFSPRSN